MTPKRSHEPLVWSLFGAGGMAAGFVFPGLLLITAVLLPAGWVDGSPASFARFEMISQHWLGKLCWLAVISLPMWHAMHRIYHGLHDIHIGGGRLSFMLCYGFAALITLFTGFVLLSC